MTGSEQGAKVSSETDINIKKCRGILQDAPTIKYPI
jgi:hypothetical protein